MDLTAALWRKSSYSGNNGGNCVEVAQDLPDVIAVRDSKDPNGPALVISTGAWRSFLTRAKAGEFSQA